MLRASFLIFFPSLSLSNFLPSCLSNFLCLQTSCLLPLSGFAIFYGPFFVSSHLLLHPFPSSSSPFLSKCNVTIHPSFVSCFNCLLFPSTLFIPLPLCFTFSLSFICLSSFSFPLSIISFFRRIFSYAPFSLSPKLIFPSVFPIHLIHWLFIAHEKRRSE